jgi:uncharacterized protein DUF669
MPNTISVNFEGVEAGMNYVHIPEGDYGLKVVKVQSKVGQESGKPYLLFSLKAISGNPKGVNKVIPHNCSLTKNALWNLRNLLEATGKTIPAKAIKIDLDKLTGLTMGGTIIDDEYEGKKKSVVTAFFPLSELSTEAEKPKADEEVVGDDAEATDAEAEGGEEEEELFG